MHITIRLAWHNNGWNGHICDEPEKNTYCIGRHSYPGDYIKGARDLDWEMQPDVKGKPCGSLTSGIPACGFSINAFGGEKTKAKINPLHGLTKKLNLPSLIFLNPQYVFGITKACIQKM
ncbi:MAG: hypothetical protein IPI62_13570 [Bacteroidetes bacterium]|nr:hypothetical protein [Bacteroidota bacterium]